MKKNRFGLLAAATLLAGAAIAGSPSAYHVATVDGTLDSGYSGVVAQQTWNTQFGNANGNLIGGNGGELDALYVCNDDTNLYLMFTGNLETNGNAIVFFLDTPSGAGSNPVPNIAGSKDGFFSNNDGFGDAIMPAGFAPEFGFVFKFFNNPVQFVAIDADYTGTPTSNFTPDTSTGATTNPALGSFTLSGAAISFGLNNANTAGVSGGDTLTTDDPLAVTTGFEVAIPLTRLGLAPGDEVLIFSVYSNGSFGGTTFLSNQFLPPYTGPAPFGNLGGPTGGPPAIYDFSSNFTSSIFQIATPPASAQGWELYN
jgi:hypothetical protein